MAQMNGMEKRNFTNSMRNGGKTAEMRNNSANCWHVYLYHVNLIAMMSHQTLCRLTMADRQTT